jgi:[acyl-carrier-protein] S-malonyltransferase
MLDPSPAAQDDGDVFRMAVYFKILNYLEKKMTVANLAFVFPGQGSQKVGMLAEIATHYSIIEKTFAEASEVLGYNSWEMIQQGEQQTLNLTENTQPLLLVSSIALWRVWQENHGAKPALMAGHSLGEFSALVAAGTLQFADAVELVRQRGRFMQTAVPVGEGAMAAILGLEDEKIVELCKEASSVGCVEAVNFNSPGQVVIAGHVAAVDKAIELLKAAGLKRALPLPVSAPFHTSLMKPAGEKLAVELHKLHFAAPQIPVVHNVTAKTETDPDVIRELLIQQIYSPVLWTQSVEFMAAHGITTTIECGPGKVLSGLNKRIVKEMNTFALETPDELAKALAG